jgi:predicted secreted hydrolase
MQPLCFPDARRLLLPAFLLLCAACSRPEPDSGAEPESGRVLSAPDSAGFARVVEKREFSFPEDHGPHPDYRTEWWYVTGNLHTPERRRFGFQVTFFRQGLKARVEPRSSRWAASQAFMAHFAVSDAAAGRYRSYERRTRGALELAGARAAPFRVWLEDWRLEAEQDGDFPWIVDTREGGDALHLKLWPQKALVLQGEAGLSRKSAEAGNASYYYSATRLNAEGFVTTEGQRFPVSGLAWLDREWSTSALAPYQAGWDWFSLQFEDGTELMYYQLRHKDGGIDPYSSGSRIDAAGVKTPLAREDVELVALDHWQTDDGVRYPARWRLTVKPLGKTFFIRPLLADQEVRHSVRYWEGAVDAFAAGSPETVVARGYMELTGYARSETE